MVLKVVFFEVNKADSPTVLVRKTLVGGEFSTLIVNSVESFSGTFRDRWEIVFISTLVCRFSILILRIYQTASRDFLTFPIATSIFDNRCKFIISVVFNDNFGTQI